MPTFFMFTPTVHRLIKNYFLLMNKKPHRIMIYPRDIQNITGRRPRTATRIHNQIKKHYGKMKNDFLTVAELCQYWKIDPEIVKAFLVD